MKRFIATLLLALFAGAVFAGDRSGPFQRSPLAPPALQGMRDPLDPVTYPPSSDAALPDLGASEAPRLSGDMHARRLPGERVPTSVESYGARRQSIGPRPYWENDPLFTAPPL